MSIYLSNRDGDGKTNEEGHYRLQTKVLQGQVLGPNALEVTETDPLSLGVAVQVGDYRLEVADGWAYTGWIDSEEEVTISTADPANPRYSVIVLYIDKDETTAPSPPNNPDIAKLMSVDGTAAPSPSIPSGSAIQAAVGAGNPYMVLATVLVGTAATQITNSNITDEREVIKITPEVLNGGDLLNAMSTAQIQAAIGPIMYPVGSLYFNGTSSTNPATLLGFGTWEVYAAGRVPVGYDSGQTEFDSIGETGGIKETRHAYAEWGLNSSNFQDSGANYITSVTSDINSWLTGGGSSTLSQSTTVRNLGGTIRTQGTTATEVRHKRYTAPNLQPYITVRIWRRTA